MNLASAVNIADLRTLARRRLPRVIFDFMDGGAEDEITLRANCEGFARYRFRPRLLTANAKRDLSITLFGQKFNLPFMIAPTGLTASIGVRRILRWPRRRRRQEPALRFRPPRRIRSKTLGRQPQASSGFSFILGPTVRSAHACSSGRSLRIPDAICHCRFGDRGSSGARRAPSLLPRGDAHPVGRAGRLMHPDWLVSVWLAGGGMPKIVNVAEFLPPVRARPTWPSSPAPGETRC